MENFLIIENINPRSLIEIGVKIVISILVIIIGIFLSKASAKIIKKASKDNIKADDTAILIICKIVKYGILIICLILILSIFGVQSTSLLAILGSAGLAIGLALKNTLGNIAAGIILIFLRSYKIGEFIEFGAISGNVREITLFTTILETQEGIYISSPNSCIWGVPLKNYSRNGKRRVDIPVKISCAYSLDTAIQTIKKITNSESGILQEPAAQVVVQSVQDKNVILVVRAWVTNERFQEIFCRMTREIKEKMEEAGIQI
ncbi:MAG: mechanosensitive ion channel family protein [Treponema sp.]|nr:mechanosensitive ion channel family protein [Treponema sp.]